MMRSRFPATYSIVKYYTCIVCFRFQQTHMHCLSPYVHAYLSTTSSNPVYHLTSTFSPSIYPPSLPVSLSSASVAQSPPPHNSQYSLSLSSSPPATNTICATTINRIVRCITTHNYICMLKMNLSLYVDGEAYFYFCDYVFASCVISK